MHKVIWRFLFRLHGLSYLKGNYNLQVTKRGLASLFVRMAIKRNSRFASMQIERTEFLPRQTTGPNNPTVGKV